MDQLSGMMTRAARSGGAVVHTGAGILVHGHLTSAVGQGVDDAEAGAPLPTASVRFDRARPSFTAALVQLHRGGYGNTSSAATSTPCTCAAACRARRWRSSTGTASPSGASGAGANTSGTSRCRASGSSPRSGGARVRAGAAEDFATRCSTGTTRSRPTSSGSRSATRGRRRSRSSSAPASRSARRAICRSRRLESDRNREGEEEPDRPGRARHRQPPEDPQDAKARWSFTRDGRRDGAHRSESRLDPRPVRPARRGAGFARVSASSGTNVDLRVDSVPAGRAVRVWLVGVKVEFECAGGHRTPIKPCVASLGPERNARGLKWRRKMPKGRGWIRPRALHPSSTRVRGEGGDVRARHRGGVKGQRGR